MFDSNLEVTIHDLRTGFSNCTIDLHPCKGCIYRGSCDGEQYIEPGDYCSSKALRGEDDAK